jgi:hypothetical protein
MSFLAGLEAGRKSTGHVERGWAIKAKDDITGEEEFICVGFSAEEMKEEWCFDKSTGDEIVPVEIMEMK